LAREVRRAECQADSIPVCRRVSGGATIVTGPGCLMYAAVLSYQREPELRLLDRAHRYVMERQQRAMARLGLECRIEGTSDLTWRGKKFSGNSLRCRRYGLLYHGTLLYDFPIALLERCLGVPARQPAYRAERSHGDFVTNLPVHREPLIAALRSAWGAEEVMPGWPAELTARLAQEKYQRLEWTERH
jgi:lipoate-protein ligase A